MTDDNRHPDTSTESTGNEWEFEEGDIIREGLESFAPGGIGLGKSEYRVKRLLRGEHNGRRFYHVEKEQGGSHLYSASTIENSYEVIPPSESGAWSEGGIE